MVLRLSLGLMVHGKSNIQDAIKWVLGEQSLKALRGAKSDDIIFSGTANRKSQGFAEVNITFDNSDKTLPIEFEEVTITRRVYRTGETGYFINKSQCRLKDVLELFMDTGIGKDGYSIIGQGRIDSILSNKSEDRRRIFDEACGIVKYRTRRDEAEKRIEQTRLNLVRINDIITEIESNLDNLKDQADVAKKYLEYKEQLKDIEISLYLYKIENNKQKMTEVKENKEIFDAQLVKEEQKSGELQSEKEELKNKIDEITKEIERIQSQNSEVKAKIEKINSNIDISKERINNNSQNKDRLENEIREIKNSLTELEKEKKERDVKKNGLVSNKKKYDEELKEKQKALDEITSKLSKSDIENETKKRKVESLVDEKYELSNELTEKNTNIENLTNRLKQEKKELDQVIRELDKKRDEKNSFLKTFSEIQKQKEDREKDLEDNRKAVEDFEKAKTDIESEYQSLVDEKRITETKYNFLIETERENEGYGKAVKNILNASKTNKEIAGGLKDVIANIISTDDKFQIAIEMALGNSIQNVVTKDEYSAKQMIEFLRTNNLGRATFLPMTLIKAKLYDDTIPKEKGVYGLASNLVNYDSQYKNIIISLLGRTIIVEDMDTAIKLAKGNKSFKIVTLKGDIINAGGSMTGGEIFKKDFKILGRSKEIEKLAKKIKQLENDINVMSNERTNLLNKNKYYEDLKEEIREKLGETGIKYAQAQEKLNSIEELINSINNNKEKRQEAIKSFESQLEKTKTEKQEIEKQINEKATTIEQLNKEVNEYSEKNKSNKDYIDNLNFDITNLKISVSSFDESLASINENLERIELESKDGNQKLTNKQTQIDGLVQKNKELEKLIEELNKEKESIDTSTTTSETQQTKLKEDREKANTKLAKVEEDITKQFEIIQDIKSQIIKVELKETSLNEENSNLINELWNDYEITPNMAMKNEEYKRPSNIREAENTIKTLKESIKGLGDINVTAIEEYKKTKDRYDTMNEQRLDLETTISKLQDISKEMVKTMKEQFKEKFKLINIYFNEVFKELFGGGKGELVLEDDENVLESEILIKVEPVGKKLQNMMLLSGGERALSAIALLFAILKINPSPFCILDEIEAALDDANVFRFAEYLKKFSETTQFLIITHRKGTMEASDRVYGVTMEENGISKILSMNLKQ